MQLIVGVLLVCAVSDLWGAAVPLARSELGAPMELEEQNDDRVFEMCQKSGINTRLAHPVHCNRFISCTTNGPVMFECPSHLMYSIVKQLCDWPENVECGDQETLLGDEMPQTEIQEPELVDQLPEIIENNPVEEIHEPEVVKQLPEIVQNEPTQEDGTEKAEASQESESSEESSSSESESEEDEEESKDTMDEFALLTNIKKEEKVPDVVELPNLEPEAIVKLPEISNYNGEEQKKSQEPEPEVSSHNDKDQEAKDFAVQKEKAQKDEEEEESDSSSSSSSEESDSAEKESTDEEHEGEELDEPTVQLPAMPNEQPSIVLPYKPTNPAPKDPVNTKLQTCWCFPLCPAGLKTCPARPAQMPPQFKTLLDVIGNEFFNSFDPNFQ